MFCGEGGDGMMKACSGNRRKTPNDFWFQEETNAGDVPGYLKACGVTYNEQETAMASVVAPYSAKIFSYWNAATVLFFTNLSLDFLLFSPLIHNQTRLACKHWWRWVRRTSFNPLRRTMPCRASDTILGIPFFLAFWGSAKIRKNRKAKVGITSLLCMLEWIWWGWRGVWMWTFSYDPYPKHKTESKVVSIINLVNNSYYMFIHGINALNTWKHARHFKEAMQVSCCQELPPFCKDLTPGRFKLGFISATYRQLTFGLYSQLGEGTHQHFWAWIAQGLSFPGLWGLHAQFLCSS